jgi:signal transduction histidine kinase/tetratricopeptide (TPR) repeat protein
VKGRTHRKQIFLFLAAVLLPSLVLIGITLRMVQQERELAHGRLAQEQSRKAREIGQFLLIKLDNIQIQETAALSGGQVFSASQRYENPEVELICLVEDRRLILPWDKNRGLMDVKKFLSEPAFSQGIQAAEKAEFASKNYVRAADLYNRLVTRSEIPSQKEYARLLLARSLYKAGRKAVAISQFRSVLSLSLKVTDEYGIPLSLYAAGRLLDLESDPAKNYEKILAALREEVSRCLWLSPGACYQLRDLLSTIIGKEIDESIRKNAVNLLQTVADQTHKMELALALQNDFLSLGLLGNQGRLTPKNRSLWAAYADLDWIICLSPVREDDSAVLTIVNTGDLLNALRNDDDFRKTIPIDFTLVSESRPAGFSPGPSYKGIRVKYAEDQDRLFADPWILRPVFYLVALCLILGITLMGAYFLWRDVRREVRMSEMRSQFVSSVIHELKTPLTAIRMFAETMRMGRSRNPQTQAEYLDTIINESERLTRLLNNVLDFSKIGQGKKIYRPEKTSLYEIIRSAAKAVEYPLSQQGFTLKVRTEEGIPEAYVDKDAIKQALLNLLSNAMKYSGDSRDITLSLRKGKGGARIVVRDFGIGIAPQEKEQIFEKYYRISSPENERIVGTGLGLAMVAHIVRAHGGRIELDSRPGEGSTFSILFPLESEV